MHYFVNFEKHDKSLGIEKIDSEWRSIYTGVYVRVDDEGNPPPSRSVFSVSIYNIIHFLVYFNIK